MKRKKGAGSWVLAKPPRAAAARLLTSMTPAAPRHLGGAAPSPLPSSPGLGGLRRSPRGGARALNPPAPLSLIHI